MSAISLKSITGITSITTPAGVDNQLTLHTNNTTERVKIDVAGNVHVNNHLAVSGITTTTDNLNIDADNKKLQIGDSQDLQLFHDGGHSRITNTTGILKLTAPAGQSVRVVPPDDSGNVAVFHIDGSTHLYYDSAHKFSTLSDGIDVVGNITMMDSLIHRDDTNTKIRFPTNDQISFETGGSEQMKVAGTNITLGTNSTAGHILQIKNRNVDSQNTNALGLDIQAAWMRIGDGLSGGQTYSNGLGIKFHDSGVIHWSIGKIGTSFYISNTSNSGTELFPSSRTDALVLTSTGKVGIGSAIPAEKLDVTGNIKFGTVQGTNTNADFNVLFQTASGVIDGGSGLVYNPAEDALKVNGNNITSQQVNGATNLLMLSCANYSSTANIKISDKVNILVEDNNDDAFTVKQGTNEYITVDTTNSSELITLGNNTTHPKIILDGNVGIHTTTPYSALEIQGDAGVNDAMITFTRHGSPSNGTIIGQNFYRIGTDSVAGFGAYRESAMDDAYFAFHTQNTGGSYAERFRITSVGKVGIGDDNPFHTLSVKGANDTTFDNLSLLGLAGTDAYDSGNAGSGINFNGKYNNSGAITTLAQISGIKENNTDGNYDGALTFGTRNTAEGVNIERLRITSDGLLKLAGLTLSQRNSATGVAGGLIYNSDGKIFQYYDGSGWVSLNTTNQIVATGGNTVFTGTGAAAGYKIHDFQSNGTFEITSGFGEVEVLVVAGGGSEGGANAGCHAGGGGGGGGVVYKKMNMSAGKYTVTVGYGGLWRQNGGNSVFGSGTDHQITALGGGAGGPTLTGNGNAGGSGGGASRHTTTNLGGAAQQPSSTDGGFGNAGGDIGSNTYTGGGGGAGGAGQDGDAANAGRGGAGKQFTQFGVAIYFGAGGNSQSSASPEGQTPTATNGAGNTGAGGGGSLGGLPRSSGGSGRVMIRYPAAS